MTDLIPAALPDLQEALPLWWNTEEGELAHLLAVLGDSLDLVASLIEARDDDIALATATDEALYRTFAYAWGMEFETLGAQKDVLRAMIVARARETGTAASLLNSLMALLDTPANAGRRSAVNLIPNPSFTTNLTGWSAYDGGQATVTISWHATAYGRDGGGGMRVARTAGTAHNAGAKLSGNGPAVTPGEQYTASAWVKGLDANIGNGQCSVYMEWLDGGGSFISDSTNTMPFTGAWQRVHCTAEAPANAATCRVYVWCNSADDGDYFDVDQAMLTDGPLFDYFDGTFPHCAWSGTANNSPSNGWVIDGSAIGSGSLVFPYDGSGLVFPIYPYVLGKTWEGTVSTGETPPGAGPGLTFSENAWLEITEDPPNYAFTVTVKSWLDFDRDAFERTVERFRPAHLVAPTIIEET